MNIIYRYSKLTTKLIITSMPLSYTIMFKNNTYCDSKIHEKYDYYLKQNQNQLRKLIPDDPSIIKFISNPTYSELKKAILLNGSVIKFIDDPSEELQLLSIKNNVNNIKYILKPTYNVQLKAVQKNGHTIAHIENPSEEIQMPLLQKMHCQLNIL